MTARPLRKGWPCLFIGCCRVSCMPHCEGYLFVRCSGLAAVVPIPSTLKRTRMFKKLFAALGTKPQATAAAARTGLYSPYGRSDVDFMYNLLFCDDIDLFRNPTLDGDPGPWPVLLADPPDTAALMAFAAADGNEGRLRALAYNRLREAGVAIPVKQLLGVIVEVPLEQGLDVLAAFSDGGVRYLNQSGKIAVFEGDGTPVADLAKDLLEAARPVVEQIGPWEEPRPPPPVAGNVRITFLVSDGLYFGEGPFGALQADAMAGPVLSTAAALLRKAVDVGLA